MIKERAGNFYPVSQPLRREGEPTNYNGLIDHGSASGLVNTSRPELGGGCREQAFHAVLPSTCTRVVSFITNNEPRVLLAGMS